MSLSSDPIRWVIIAFVAAGLFALGLYTYIERSVSVAREQALASANAEAQSAEARGPSLLDGAASVAERFVAQVGAGRFAEAHGLLAAPYRRAVSVDAFAASCRASAILAGARAVTLRELRQQTAGTATTVEARGLLDSSQGAVPVGFVFMSEGGALRILVVSLAGVPVLQGLTPR